MERLGLGSPALRSYDKALFLKRLRRLGLTEQQLTTEIAAPVAGIDSAIPSGKFVDLKAHCQDPKGALKLNEKLKLVPGHCDPTCNVYDWYVGVRNGKVECLWPVTARGMAF